MKQSQIFISYTRANYQIAHKLYDELLSDGYWVWIDKRLEEAKEWEPQIDENLRKSKTLIALISSKSVGSDWVKHEGSIAFALNQLLIPVKIEPFGNYSASNLPIWAAKIQLLELIEGSPNYNDQYQRLKQILGSPLPIRQHIEEMLIHYKNSGMLLDEVALALIEKHYNELYLPEDKKILADKLIEESRRKLDNYWMRLAKLEKDYENAQVNIRELKAKLEKDYETSQITIRELKANANNLGKKIESYIGDFKFQHALIIFLCFAIAYYVFIMIYLYFN